MEKQINNYTTLIHDIVSEWSRRSTTPEILIKPLSEVSLSSAEGEQLIEGIDQFVQDKFIRCLYNLDSGIEGRAFFMAAAAESGVTPEAGLSRLDKICRRLPDVCCSPGGKLSWFLLKIAKDQQTEEAQELIDRIGNRPMDRVESQLVDNFNLSIKLRNSLARARVITVGDLKNLLGSNQSAGLRWYSKIHGMGRGLASEAIEKIAIPCGLIDPVDAVKYIK